MRFYNGDVITTEEKQQKFKNSSTRILVVPLNAQFYRINTFTVHTSKIFLESSLLQSAEFYTVSAKQMRQYHLPYLNLLS
uniref:Uncharacterized protein n=1 Tax=Aegilops tauschii subsp. strangulata TaxID=200361 RepID=A0A453F1M0_AEGTS